MVDCPVPLTTLQELREFVHLTLCEKENLLPEQSRLEEYQLIKHGKPCGLNFFVLGPRLVRLSALWAADHNVLYFYDAKGERYLKMKLSSRISFEPAAASA